MTNQTILREIAAAQAENQQLARCHAEWQAVGATIIEMVERNTLVLSRLTEILELHYDDPADVWKTGDGGEGDA